MSTAACPGCQQPLLASEALSDCTSCGARQHTPCWARFSACASCQAASRWATFRDQPPPEPPKTAEPVLAPGGHEPHHTVEHYVKIWAILLALLLVSVVGPFLGITVVTLITAFGVAGVKAYLVAKNFMHLDVESRYVHYALAVGVGFMVLFFAGTAPDVKQHYGLNWDHWNARNHVERALQAEEQAGEHGEAHGEGAAH